MYLLFFVVLINLFLMVLNLRRYKDVLSPPVLFSFFWSVSLVGVIRIPFVEDIHLSTAIVLAMGALLFHIGFNLAVYFTKESEDVSVANPHYIKYVVIFLSVIFCYSMYDLLSHGSGDTLYRILINKENENLNLSGHLKKIIEFISLGFLIVYLKNPILENRKRIRAYVFVFVVMGLLCVFSIPSRNAMLQFFLPLIVIFLSAYKLSAKKQVGILLLGFLLFMGYYSIISSNKYFYLYEKSNKASEILSSEINTYLSGSIVAFDLAKDENVYSRAGKNTFRFFYAVYDKVHDSNSAEKLANDFFSQNGFSTNVFTFYDFYSRDFGFAYALIIQFLLSLIYGFVYKKRNTSQGLFFYAALSYPLVMQFFQDQYISLTSTWLQIIIISIFLFNTNLFQTRAKITYNRVR